MSEKFFNRKTFHPYQFEHLISNPKVFDEIPLIPNRPESVQKSLSNPAAIAAGARRD